MHAERVLAAYPGETQTSSILASLMWAAHNQTALWQRRDVLLHGGKTDARGFSITDCLLRRDEGERHTEGEDKDVVDHVFS